MAGSLPAEITAWKHLNSFNVAGNKLHGTFPPLNFAALKDQGHDVGCFLLATLSIPIGHTNKWYCPWPAGLTQHCYADCQFGCRLITAKDCHGVAPPTPSPTPPPSPPTYSCVAAKGQCFPNASSTQTQAACEAACFAPTPPPTPAPPASTYSCDSSTGRCFLDGKGTQTAAQCEGSCVCAIPHNCGQLNGTYVCGKKIESCNVCDECCEFYVLPQANCNECVAQAPPPAGKGCGWPNMTDLA
jgi:hypothetical protein